MTHDAEYLAAEKDVRAIIDTAIESAGANQLDEEGRLYAIVAPEGAEVTIIDTAKVVADAAAALEKYEDRPKRKRGEYTVRDVPSFAAYMGKHSNEHSEVWADQLGGRITAVIDADTGLEGPGWGQHRLIYPALKTPEWLAWEKLDGVMSPQITFAEHIEDRLADILEPPAADMLELAQSFQATTGVRFESSRRINSGEQKLEYKETVDATAGKSGDITIPDKFYIALRPFEGSEGFRIECRFRYRMANGQLTLGYKMTRPEDVLREAFDTLVSSINEALENESVTTQVPVLLGTAPAAR